MLSEKGTYNDDANDDDSPQLHAEITAVQFDERLLPIYEEQHRNKMLLEQRQQEDNTKITLQLLADTSTITKRGQIIGGSIAIVALIGGLILVAVDKEAGGRRPALETLLIFTRVLQFLPALQPGFVPARPIVRHNLTVEPFTRAYRTGITRTATPSTIALIPVALVVG